jgi:hypothetical protein
LDEPLRRVLKVAIGDAQFAREQQVGKPIGGLSDALLKE